MNLLLLGVSHHTAPVDLRERVDFSKRGIVTALRELGRCPSPTESVVLTTCNRSEIYVACEDTELARDDLAGFMSRFHDIPESELAPHLYTRTEGDVAQHLFRVAAGLDSLVVGEPQIFGQVKDAYATAAGEQCTGTLLNKLFPWSFAVGKRVRADTGLGEGAVSVSYAAISLARKIFGNLKGLSVLVVGAGEMAELTAVHLHSQQVHRITVTSRTLTRASELAERVDGVAVDWSTIDEALLQVDVVVTATGAPTPILTRASIEQVMHARRNRPLFIIDVGLPRDVDPSPATSSRCSSTTSTICGPSSARIWRGGRNRPRGPKRWSRMRRRSSSSGSVRGGRSRPSSPCAAGSRRSARPSSNGSSRS